MWKRWPIIRHARYFWLLRQVNHHYETWMHMGALPVYADRDYEVLDRIWSGDA